MSMTRPDCLKQFRTKKPVASVTGRNTEEDSGATGDFRPKHVLRSHFGVRKVSGKGNVQDSKSMDQTIRTLYDLRRNRRLLVSL